MPLVHIDKQVCKGCELCVAACPQGVLGRARHINTRGYFPAEVTRGGQCIGCRICAVTCPDVAITVTVHGVHYELFQY